MYTTLIALLLAADQILVVTGEDNYCRNQTMPITNCCDLKSKFFTFDTQALSGVYLVENFCAKNCLNAEAYCDASNGGGWLVVQRRQDESVDFNKSWVEYEDGFGNLTGEFWYGLKALHCLTGQGGWEMRIDIKLDNGTSHFFQYEQFKVASTEENYKLTVGGFQGSATDKLTSHSGMNFTTYDRDNDRHVRHNCALWPGGATGGWWYDRCGGIWANNQRDYRILGINLRGKDGHYQWHALPFIQMKIRHNKCKIGIGGQ